MPIHQQPKLDVLVNEIELMQKYDLFILIPCLFQYSFQVSAPNNCWLLRLVFSEDRFMGRDGAGGRRRSDPG